MYIGESRSIYNLHKVHDFLSSSFLVLLLLLLRCSSAQFVTILHAHLLRGNRNLSKTNYQALDTISGWKWGPRGGNLFTSPRTVVMDLFWRCFRLMGIYYFSYSGWRVGERDGHSRSTSSFTRRRFKWPVTRSSVRGSWFMIFTRSYIDR